MKLPVLVFLTCLSLTAFGQCPPGYSEVEVVINPDNWPQETSWDVRSDLGQLLASGASNGGTVCLEEGSCFVVTIFDTYGDGIFEPGGYEIYLDDNLIAAGGTEFDHEISHYSNCPEKSMCILAETIQPADFTASLQNEWYEFSPLESGLFEITTCGSGCNSSVWVYEQCGEADDSDLNALEFNTDGCDDSGQITMAMIYGNTYYIRIGTPEECPSLNWSLIHLGDFDMCEDIPGMVEVIVDIQPDAYPNETSWTLTDGTGNLLFSGGAEGTTVCVDEEACIIFTIFDSYGDGIFNPGGYWFYYDGELVGNGNNFGYGTFEEIGCPAGTSCNSPEVTGEGSFTTGYGSHWYSFTPAITGSYLISTCDLNTCDTRIQIYDYCNMSNFDDTQVAAIYFNDNNEECGMQAFVNAGLEGGTEYWIRVSEVNEDCGGAINWLLEYNGPVEGCMDPAACNYNPLAEISDDSCIYPGDPECPDGPDLVIDEDYLQATLQVSSITVGEADCYINEGCLNGYGSRELIRFGTRIDNIGNLDWYIGNANSTPQMFSYDNCHNHNHVDGYAEYLLYEMDGTEIPIGFKFGFCVMDLTCDMGGTAQYGCGTMGISAMCSDIYSSGLTCQWIDVTDVADGSYTLVVRTNWEGLPDGLGNHELNYNNNWGQACIQIDRSSGSLQVALVDECEPMVDCAGEIYGSAQPDCNGDCNGSALRGDLDANSAQDLVDAHLYVDQILGNDINATSCTDLNQDDEITVTDAALMARCDIYNVAHEHPDSSGVHSHCNFPSAHLINPFDSVFFNMTNLNLAENYFDIMVKNPNCKIVGFQLEITGADITNVEMLYNNENYPITPEFTYGGQTLIGLSYEDSVINKNLSFVPLLRVYYTNAGTEICLGEVVDVVNDDYENTWTFIEKNCMMVTGISKNQNDFSATIAPNPMNDGAVLEFSNTGNNDLQLEIRDLSGRLVQMHSGIRGNRFIIDRNDMASGVYLYRLSNQRGESVGRLVVQ